MKKLVSLVLVLSMTLCLFGCGKKAAKETVTTLTGTQNGVDIVLALHAEGDVIKSIEQTSTLSLEGMSEDILASLDGQIEEMTKQYNEIEGLKYTADKSDTALVEKCTMDVSKKETLKNLIDKKLLPVTNDNADYLSLEQSIKGFEASGLTVSK